MKKFKEFLIEYNATEAQIKAGNYKKHHRLFQGLDISIENLKGSVRSGIDPDGNEWSSKMPFDYGYIKGTKGNDGDHVDVFIGKNKESEKVFVVNQLDHKKDFDEHKVMLGFNTNKQALKGYLSAYDAGWDQYDDVVDMTMDEFKEWLKTSTQRKECTKKDDK